MNYLTILKGAIEAPYSPAPISGCGRVYVMIAKEHARGIKAAADKLNGVRYLAEAYGVGKRALYVGYDNATGIELGRGTAIANALKAAGISCYRDEMDD